MKLVALIFASAACATSAVGQTSPAKIIAGYRCMMLNITEQQSMDPNFHVVVRQAPSLTAPMAGWATAVVIVPDHAAAQNGFVPMLRGNGELAWISQSEIKPYKPVAAPNARCVPEVLPNGRVGIGPG